MSKPIFVARPSLPPLEEYVPFLEEIWETRVLSNGGQFHTQLETELASYLGVEHLSLFASGTAALLLALRALGVDGEVITTPYSFAATANALVWNGLTPTFIDIDRKTLNLDARAIEAAITDRTTAILGVHSYGNPCDVASIEKIASRNNLKVIYDAAHAFSVEDSGGSVLRHGDMAVISTHATKVFNTFEGGIVVCKSEAQKEELDRLKNFGFEDPMTINTPGLNGKMSEVSAALGLVQLRHVSRYIEERKAIHDRYKSELSGIKGLQFYEYKADIRPNFSYFPVFITKESRTEPKRVLEKMAERNIHCRRYFYPLISNFPYYLNQREPASSSTPNAISASDTVLCLPIYSDMTEEDLNHICSTLKAALG